MHEQLHTEEFYCNVFFKVSLASAGVGNSPIGHGMQGSVPVVRKATPYGGTPCLQQSLSLDMAESMKLLEKQAVFL